MTQTPPLSKNEKIATTLVASAILFAVWGYITMLLLGVVNEALPWVPPLGYGSTLAVTGLIVVAGHYWRWNVKR